MMIMETYGAWSWSPRILWKNIEAGLKKSLDPQVGHMPIRCHGALKIIKVEVEALNEKPLEDLKTMRSAFAFKS